MPRNQTRPSALVMDEFGASVFASLTLDEICTLARDVYAIEREEFLPAREAVRVLRQRIGGPRALKCYCACLVAGEKRRGQ